jgi:hypothetical protein
MLRRIATASGGRVLTQQDDLLDRSIPRRKDRTPLWPMLAVIGLSLFFIDIVARRVQFQLPARRKLEVKPDQVDVTSPALPRRAIAARRMRREEPDGTARPEGEPASPETSGEEVDRSEDLKKLIEARRKRRKRSN